MRVLTTTKSQLVVAAAAGSDLMISTTTTYPFLRRGIPCCVEAVVVVVGGKDTRPLLPHVPLCTYQARKEQKTNHTLCIIWICRYVFEKQSEGKGSMRRSMDVHRPHRCILEYLTTLHIWGLYSLRRKNLGNIRLVVYVLG